MFFQLLFIHLFRPFLRYKQSTSPLPAHVSPRKNCTQAATTISKLLRLYKRTYGLRQIVNIAVYILHSACTIHLLNLPEKNAERDIVHGLKHLEEISESWLCARKTLAILQASSRRWNIQLPKDAEKVFQRMETKFKDQLSPKIETSSPHRTEHHNALYSLPSTQKVDAIFGNLPATTNPAYPPVPLPSTTPLPAPPVPRQSASIPIPTDSSTTSPHDFAPSATNDFPSSATNDFPPDHHRSSPTPQTPPPILRPHHHHRPLPPPSRPLERGPPLPAPTPRP